MGMNGSGTTLSRNRLGREETRWRWIADALLTLAMDGEWKRLVGDGGGREETPWLLRGKELDLTLERQ